MLINLDMERKIKVLVGCSKGLNRSKYLAEYLRRKGYSTRFGGVEGFDDPKMEWNPITQKLIDWSDIVIVVRKRLREVLRKKFKIKSKKIVVVDVTDSKRLIPEELSHLRDLDYLTFQKKWTRPQLRKAIKPHLPLKLK